MNNNDTNSNISEEEYGEINDYYSDYKDVAE